MVRYTKRMSALYTQKSKLTQAVLEDAIIHLKKMSIVKFIESIDLVIMLGIDPKKTEQNIRGNVILPYHNGQKKYVAVFATGEDAIQAKQAGAEYIGMEDLATKISKRIIIKKINTVIATPDTMHIVSKLATILGPKGLMPNPKLGTITNNIYDTIIKIKKGQVNFRNDKNGIIHVSIGKINFDNNFIKQNILCFLKTIKKNKPNNIKGNFIHKIYLSTTMGIAIDITTDCINNY
ncbi:50S ribosomal protein L1 [Enterobacteriaceae endosymbiont of Macroplea mutica]|nr:50S ribosomal protein L1 [Enterobacteriaceae endosymbiont of Macroplea mutica]